MRRLLRKNAWAVGLSAICFALYVWTLAPSLLGGDAGELQLVPPLLSLAHPTGYPLHSLLGYVWSHIIPIGSIAWRMNLLIATAAAIGVGLLYQCILELTHARIAAALAALAFATAPIFWGQAVLADKYALNAALLCAVLWAVVREHQSPNTSTLARTALFYGFSLTHHRSMLVFGPLIVAHWLWLYRRQWRNVRLWLIAIVGVIAPLSLYLYLPFAEQRGLPPNLWHPRNLRDWLVYLSDAQFIAAVRPDQSLIGNLQYYGQTLREQFGWLGLALGGLGLITQLKKRRWAALGLLIGFVAQAVLTSGYQVFRNWVFFIPSFVLFSVWMGEGLAAIQSILQRISARAAIGTLCTALVGLGLIAPTFATTYPRLRDEALDGGPFDLWRNDLKHGYQAQRFVQNSLPYALPNSWILADWEQATPLWYAQQLDQQRRDVSVFYPLELLNGDLINQRPVYIGRTYPSLGNAYHYSAHGALLRVTTHGEYELPFALQPSPATWDDQIELLGYRTHQTDLQTGRVLPISLFFRAKRQTPVNYAISVRLLDRQGNLVAQEDREAFALGMAFTSHWNANEIVGDYFELSVPRAGEYQVGLVLYEKMPDGQLRNATLANSDSPQHLLAWIMLG